MAKNIWLGGLLGVGLIIYWNPNAAQEASAGDPSSQAQQVAWVANSDIASAAKAWVGKDFNPGVPEQCAYFVRQVLKDAGVALSPPVTQQPLDGLSTGAGFANSFGPDQGQIIKDKSQLQAGDVVMFYNTYGNFASGTITHVAVMVSPTEFVDRPTRSDPVKQRHIDTFNFAGAIRLK